ncbi:MAG: SpoIIE family protein phosphatase [Acidisphaera sp.]|nr:SpoIIE family protein phosphatase [Acidisphaera sp.]
MQESQEDQTIFARPSREGGKLAPATEVAHTLLVRGGTAAPRRIPITGTPLTIGRVPPCDIVFPESAVSRMHCRVALVDGHVTVTDLNSTNGTFIDGERIAGSAVLQHGAVLQVATQVLTYERRTRREIEQAAAFDRDLQEASAYVQSLLPKPVQTGPVRAEWLFLPCSQLGGSAFGYQFLDATTFAAYSINVAGRGTSAAMQAVALLNLLLQPAMSGIDLRRPCGVLSKLDAMFRADRTPGTFFSIWYGIFDRATRRLEYASAGHHPALLVAPGQADPEPLATDGPAIGLAVEADCVSRDVVLPGAARLYLMSDGAFDILEAGGQDAADWLRRLTGGRADLPEPLRLYHAVREASGMEALEEDFFALIVAFD